MFFSLLFIKSNEPNFGEYEELANYDYMVGIGGYSYFKFQNLNINLNKVEVDINLEYKRSWELSAIQDFSVKVSLV